jgi:hypothetical protein
MHGENKVRISFRSDPAAVAALVVVSACALGLSVALAWPGLAQHTRASVLEFLHIADFGLSAAALVVALGIAWRLFRRRGRDDDWITVCAWTRRVKLQGRWVSFEEFMARRFNLRCTHGISDEAAEQMKREAEDDEPEQESAKKQG